MKNSQKEKPKYMSLDFSMKFQDLKPIKNTGFVRGVCKVAYAGENRNYSNITKEAFEKAESGLYGLKVVGNWLEDKKNFGGHDFLFETKGNKVVMKPTTIPYGFVPQDSNVRWESVEDGNGNTKNYQVTDVVLWKDGNEEQIEFIEKHGVNQSMEIEVIDGDWDNNYDYFVIEDFRYTALCLLGRELDNQGNKGEGNVEPCFEDSEVIVSDFSLAEPQFQKFNNMKKLYEDSLQNKEPIEKDNKEDDLEMAKTVVEPVIVDEPVITYEKEFKEVSNQLSEMKGEFELLKSDYAKLEEEVVELREYKSTKEAEIAEVEKDSLIGDYSLILSEEEMKEVIDNKADFSVEDMKIKLSTIFSNKAIESQKMSKEVKEPVMVYDNKVTQKEEVKSKFAI